MIGEADRAELLRIARATLREQLAHGGFPAGVPHQAMLLEPASAFLAIYLDGVRRSSYGALSATLPLYRAIEELAAAACHDPLHPPLDAADLARVRIAIGVVATPAPAAPGASLDCFRIEVFEE